MRAREVDYIPRNTRTYAAFIGGANCDLVGY